jgi:hypothetical protein
VCVFVSVYHAEGAEDSDHFDGGTGVRSGDGRKGHQNDDQVEPIPCFFDEGPEPVRPHVDDEVYCEDRLCVCVCVCARARVRVCVVFVVCARMCTFKAHYTHTQPYKLKTHANTVNMLSTNSKRKSMSDPTTGTSSASAPEITKFTTVCVCAC